MQGKCTGNVCIENMRINKKAKREAAVLPPSRSDRWQANFFAKKVRAVRFQLRSAAVNGRAAAGRAADFYIARYLLKGIVSGTVAMNY